MKNKVVSLYEKCAGRCNSLCKTEIRGYAADIGYESEAIPSCKDLPYIPGVVSEDSSAEVYLQDDSAGNGYCVFKIKEEQDSHTEDRFKEEPRYYYRVVTRINIVVPIVNNIFDHLGALYVTGDTKMFYPEENHTVDTYC